MSARSRLDLALEARGLARSRARARDAILRGTVSVNGVSVKKPATLVGAEDAITMADPAGAYVSRAALKLRAGLDATGWSAAGLVCLDIGASTGGFTQVLAEDGAERVYAVDVGHGQLAPEIAELPPVSVLEDTDARAITREKIPEAVDLVVCDVSFVSVTKVIDAPLELAGPEARAIVLFKPQFEVGRDHVGKGGLALPGPHVAAARDTLVGHVEALGWTRVLEAPSPLAGGDGNRETVIAFSRRG